MTRANSGTPPTDPPPNDAGGTGGAGDAGGSGVDDQRIADAVEAAVRRAFETVTAGGGGGGGGSASGGGGASSSTPAGGGNGSPPPAAPADGGGIQSAIDAAVRRALEARDHDDALAVLADQIDELRAKVTSAPTERRRGWGSYLLGPGLTRR